MIRLILVLTVCLALPINAASSVYVHLHTDSEHQNDHHDGREVHRHAEPAEPHHDGEHPDTPSPESLPAPSDHVTIAVTTPAWRPASSLVSTSMSLSSANAPWLQATEPPYALRAPVGASAPLAEDPPEIPDSPVVSTLALRGPPR